MNNIIRCNQEIMETYSFLCNKKSQTHHVVLNIPNNIFSTSFRILTNDGIKMSISHSIDTCGELETILICDNNYIDRDTTLNHKNREELLKYILQH